MKAQKGNEMGVRREGRQEEEINMFLTPGFIGKWTEWYRVLRRQTGLGRFDSMRYGLWLARG
jgi:hypothetical protein